MANQPSNPNDPLKGKKMGKWTKYGGAIYGLKVQVNEIWFCQLCGDEVPRELPPFNYELYPGEFIRVCNICQAKIDKVHEMEKSKHMIVRRVISIRRTKRD